MQFNWLKSLVQEQKFEGLFPKTPSSSPLDIRRMVKVADELDHQRDLTNAALIVVFIALVYNHATPAVVLLVVGALMDAVAHIVLYLRQRGKRYDLPLRDFLIEERNCILMRIRLLARSKNWATIPALAAFAIFIPTLSSSSLRLLMTIAGIVVLWAFIQVIHHLNVRRPLMTRLSGIDRRLAEFDAGPV